MTLAIHHSAPVGQKEPNAVNFNIFLLIQELLSDQKHQVQSLAKLAVLGTIALKDELYQQGMKAYEDAVSKISEQVDKLRAAIEAKKSDTPSIWEKAGGFFLDVTVGMIIGASIGGPIGAVIGGILGAGVSVLSHSNGKESGFTLTWIKGLFEDGSEEQITALEVQSGTEKANLARQKATQHQNEISMNMKTGLEPIQGIETTVSNILTAILKMFAKMADFQGRS